MKLRHVVNVHEAKTHLSRLLERVAASGADDARKFDAAWSSLLAEHGHRGPNEWDMRAHSWTTKPTLALSMLERLRFQSDDRSPHVAKAAAAEQREKIVAELLADVAGEPTTSGTLQAGLHSAALFYGLANAGKARASASSTRPSWHSESWVDGWSSLM